MQSIGFAFHDAADDRVGISYEIGEDYARARWPTSSAHGGEQVVQERTAGETRASAFVHLCIPLRMATAHLRAPQRVRDGHMAVWAFSLRWGGGGRER
jgi:hypothetical protein